MYSQQSISKAWGLYRKDDPNAVPLKNLDISIKIFHNIARVTYSQDYFNDTNLLIETEFFFPISPDACFDSFQATFNDITIKGVVKEKEKAKEEYKEAVEQGKTAAYSEINKETGDVMKVQIGNIPQNTNISITYSYVQKLETTLNKFWCFRLFSTLTPRYNNMSNLKDFLSHDVNLLSSYPTVSKNSSGAYPWNIQVEIHSPSPITFVKSPSHDLVSNYGNEKHTCSISLNPKDKHFPNKDFILLYTNGREDSVDYLLTPFDEGYCAMVSMLADFDKTSNEQAFENFVKAKEVENEHSMSSIRGEYIFLIDRSGSMDGDRITMARNSLALFLKSLPKDSFFNVVSFGSNFTFLHNSSIAYSQESIDTSTKQIQRFGADMGGTEIYDALNKIFNTPLKPGYPRFVFLLTDGAVSNTQKVLDLILANNNTTRTFTIGIGNGCSPELITKGAAYGRGKEEFVTDNSQIFEKVINLLNASLSPCYSDLSLNADNFDAVVKSVTPNPVSLPFLINGQTVTFFLFLRKEAFQQDSKKMNLQLRMYDSRIQKHHTVDICLDETEAFENEMIPKLAIHDMIKRLEDQKSQEIVWMDKEDVKKAILEYSLKYGILCKDTAFFCEISDNEGKFRNVLPTQVVVPTVLSNDYESKRFQSLGTVTSLLSCPPAATKSYNSGPKLSMMRTGAPIAGYSRSLKMAEQKSFSNQAKCAPERESSDIGMLKKMSNGISNAFGSLFSSDKSAPQRRKKGKASGELPPETKARNKMSQEANFFVDEEMEAKNTLQRKASEEPSEELEFLEEIGDTTKYSSFSYQSVSVTKSNTSYLEIIMKQKFEGFWDPSDQQIKQTILKNPQLVQIPTQIQVADSSQANAVWITILVLRWLEIACKNDRKAWLLIYQKGCEWLKGQGVDYETVKELGTSNIKA